MAGETASTPKFDPITVTITETTRLTGKSRASVYEAIARGQLRAVKDGARTLVTFESIKARQASLPAAKIGAPKSATA
jgi:predicted DNA-binding transcriptional regulator AlpA